MDAHKEVGQVGGIVLASVGIVLFLAFDRQPAKAVPIEDIVKNVREKLEREPNDWVPEHSISGFAAACGADAAAFTGWWSQLSLTQSRSDDFPNLPADEMLKRLPAPSPLPFCPDLVQIGVGPRPWGGSQFDGALILGESDNSIPLLKWDTSPRHEDDWDEIEGR